MTPPPYLSLSELLQRIEQPYRSGCQRLLETNRERIQAARGSTHNHQAWPGGFVDHLQEVMNIAVVLYDTMTRLRPLPFSESDALLVLFAHDLEKPWAYSETGGTWHRTAELSSKAEAQAFRMKLLAEHGLKLPDELQRATFFVEGEVDQYSNKERGMSPLAAFCHLCDVASARLWHGHPLGVNDPWSGAQRSFNSTIAVRS